MEHGGDGCPLLLIFENVHWADDVTLAWLVHLARCLRESSICVVGTYYPENGEMFQELRHALSLLEVLHDLEL
jgi:predicted ATPase